MRIATELVRETSIIDQESRDATTLLRYLNTFDNPYLATLMYSSHCRCSNHFKDDRFKKRIYRYCKVFGVTNTVKILLLERKFFIPHSVINPALRLNLNELNKTDCKNYFIFNTVILKILLSFYSFQKSSSHHLMLIECLLLKHYALFYDV